MPKLPRGSFCWYLLMVGGFFQCTPRTSTNRSTQKNPPSSLAPFVETPASFVCSPGSTADAATLAGRHRVRFVFFFFRGTRRFGVARAFLVRWIPAKSGDASGGSSVEALSRSAFSSLELIGRPSLHVLTVSKQQLLIIGHLVLQTYIMSSAMVQVKRSEVCVLLSELLCHWTRSAKSEKPKLDSTDARDGKGFDWFPMP